MLLMRVFIEMKNRHFWVRTPKLVLQIHIFKLQLHFTYSIFFISLDGSFELIDRS